MSAHDAEMLEIASAAFKRPRTVADALIVVALLLFIVGWVAFWQLTASLGESSDKHISGWAAFWVVVIVAGPPLWAGSLVKKVVDRG